MDYEVWDVRNNNSLKPYSESDARNLAKSLNDFVCRNTGKKYEEYFFARMLNESRKARAYR